MNRGIKILQTFALPLGYDAMHMVGATGLEPVTHCL